MGQQTIALLLVSCACVYLLRQWAASYRRVWRGEGGDSGCGSGCGKCSCGGKQPKTVSVPTGNRITLGEIGEFRRKA